MGVEQTEWYVYILECVDGGYYTGISKNVTQRFIEHTTSRGADFTKRFRPTRIAWQEAHDSLEAARRRELQLKGWSRKKKQRLISGII